MSGAAKVCIVVDDEPVIRMFLKKILEKENFQALEAEDAPKAYKLVQQRNGDVDLIVTDVRMPGDMDGLDLAYAVRNAFPKIAVILISGYAEPQSSERPNAAFPFIGKPFRAQTILEVVKRTLASADVKIAAPERQPPSSV